MKNLHTAKRVLSALLCTAMLMNPVLTTANASERPTYPPRTPEITEESLKDKIPAYFWIGKQSGTAINEETGEQFNTYESYSGFKANVHVSVTEIVDGDVVQVEDIDLGDYDTGSEETLIVGLPETLREKYGDSKYNVTVFVKPLNLPDDLVMADENYSSPLPEFPFAYNGEDKLEGEVHLRNKVVHTQAGVIHVKAPDKTVYKIGEEIDVTGGQTSGNGDVKDGSLTVLNWDNFGTALTADELDLSEFDNTKAGEYLIKLKPKRFDNTICDEPEDKVVYDSFYVTVVDDGTAIPKDEKPAEKDELKKGEQFKLSFNKLLSTGYDEEGNTTIDSIELKGMKFKLSCDVYDYSNYESEKVYHEDLGKFDLGEASSVTISVPEEVTEKYSDTDRYTCDFTVDPIGLPDDMVLCDTNSLKRYGSTSYAFSTSYGETNFDIYVREKIICIYAGSINVSEPDKTVYKVGEELDLTGGYTSGSGGVVIDKMTVLNWDDFGTKMTAERMDISAFDNTKPGTYIIKPKPMTFAVFDCDGVVDDINYGEFKVTVVAGEPNSSASEEKAAVVYGDANLDGDVSLADAVTIMQFVANPDKHQMTKQQIANSDVTGDNDGVTAKDALVIQKYKLNIIDKFPVSK
ncbi:MAG: dockerin type I repeat-containing protein [Ruminococcus sp.]|nr:dockerin type I repeat-containing protein [Ruminococcus sp.]